MSGSRQEQRSNQLKGSQLPKGLGRRVVGRLCLFGQPRGASYACSDEPDSALFFLVCPFPDSVAPLSPGGVLGAKREPSGAACAGIEETHPPGVSPMNAPIFQPDPGNPGPMSWGGGYLVAPLCCSRAEANFRAATTVTTAVSCKKANFRDRVLTRPGNPVRGCTCPVMSSSCRSFTGFTARMRRDFDALGHATSPKYLIAVPRDAYHFDQLHANFRRFGALF